MSEKLPQIDDIERVDYVESLLAKLDDVYAACAGLSEREVEAIKSQFILYASGLESKYPSSKLNPEGKEI